MKKIKIITASVFSSATPLIALAQTDKKFSDLVDLALWYFDQAILLLMGLAVVAFIWFVVKYFIISSDSKKSEAAQYVMWSLIGFFIIASMWGLVNVLINTFDLGSNSPQQWSGLNNLFPR